MDTETVLQIIAMFENDKKSYFKQLDIEYLIANDNSNTTDPFEAGYIKGYRVAFSRHMHILQEYIEFMQRIK